MSELAQQLIAENKAKHARGEDALPPFFFERT
jgi:hypothetical protein